MRFFKLRYMFRIEFVKYLLQKLFIFVKRNYLHILSFICYNMNNLNSRVYLI